MVYLRVESVGLCPAIDLVTEIWRDCLQIDKRITYLSLETYSVWNRTAGDHLVEL